MERANQNGSATARVLGARRRSDHRRDRPARSPRWTRLMRELITPDAYRVDLPAKVLKQMGVTDPVDLKFNGGLFIEHKSAAPRIIAAAGGCRESPAGPASRQQSSTRHIWRPRPKMRSIPWPPKHMV
jgi:hypothetical protein